MHRKDMLIELGVEEIPAGYIQPALEKLINSVKTGLDQAGLEYVKIDEYSTPRRFGLCIRELESRQRDEIIDRIGPATQIAYDGEGNLTKAATGFLKGAGASEADIYKVETDKGEKIAIRLEKKGKLTVELLPQMIYTAIESMNFPKTMRWGATRMWFARPIRWLVSLYGSELIEMEVNGIKSGRTSYGNRSRILVNPEELKSSEDYPEKLKNVEVIASREERRALILEQLETIEKQTGLEVIGDERLLETVADLVEYPTATLGNYDENYLKLPEKIIISTLSNNQKCFALRVKNGELTNKFIFINNGNPKYGEIIRHGNEKVIRARLADAEFYYQEDTKHKLESYVEKLEEVLFQKDLGNLLEKTERIRALCEYIGYELQLSEEQKTEVLRCAWLCKADLVTQMLGEKEFTKLQGYIGMKYAIVSGESESVANGIYEHYQPRGQNDELPESMTGTIVALSDKLDTVCGIMGVGMVPTGSNDPFALRRAANGIVSIIASKGLELDLEQVIEKSFALLKEKLETENNNIEIVKEFFNQRINWLLKQEGIGYDVIESVMHIDKRNIPDLLKRARAVERFRQREDFIQLVLGFKRVSNIISEREEFGEINEELLEQAAEFELYKEYLNLTKKLERNERDYERMMEELVRFSERINKFFDEVLVNVENEELRTNRYNILKKIREVFLLVADLARIVVEEKK